MPIYKINLPLTTPANVEAAGEILRNVGSHAPGMGYTISAPLIGTSADAGKLRLTISATLTAAQLTHLGLTT